MDERRQLARSSLLEGIFYTTVAIDPENLKHTLEELTSLRDRCNNIHQKCDPNCPISKAIAKIEMELQKTS